MINHSHIISLIKSLSPSEKGYIKKLFAVHHSAILKQNFEAIEKELADSAKSSSTENEINYEELFDFVLHALQGYHKSSAQEVRSLLNQVEILVDKNLYQQAEKQVNRVKGLVLNNELRHQYVEIIEWEMAMLAIKAPTVESEKKFEAMFQDIAETIQKQKEVFGK